MANQDRVSQFFWSNTSVPVLTVRGIAEALFEKHDAAALKGAEREINKSLLRFDSLNESSLLDEHDRPAKRLVLRQLVDFARKKRKLIMFAQMLSPDKKNHFLAFNDARGGRRWVRLDPSTDRTDSIQVALHKLCQFEKKNIVLIPSG